jgi:redox-sensitive bicupin YhaK (pirin superfamily)
VADTAPPDALTLVLSGATHPDAIEMRQDADVFFGRLSTGRTLTFTPTAGRSVWIHVIAGALAFNGVPLGAGDGVGLLAPDDLRIEASADAEFLLFSLAG